MFRSLSNTLQPYKGTVGQFAGIVTTAQFFTGIPICLEIRQKKSTENIPAIPFIGGIVIALALLKYAAILDDAMMTIVNTIALVLNLGYCIIYYQYSKNKYAEFIKPAIIGAAISTSLYVYCGWENPKNLEFRYGLIVTIMLLLLIGSPLVEVKEIIAKKDASKIPFLMTLMGFVVSVSWFLYGVILNNDFMIFQNIIGIALTVIQLVLIFIYPKPKKPKKA